MALRPRGSYRGSRRHRMHLYGKAARSSKPSRRSKQPESTDPHAVLAMLLLVVLLWAFAAMVLHYST